MKRIIIILCCLILLPFQMLTVYAEIKLENFAVKSYRLPKEAVYIDMLISMDKSDKSYMAFNEKNMKQYNFDVTELSEYNNKGFVSMSCHYKDNFTEMKIFHSKRYDYFNSFVLDMYSDGSLHPNGSRVYKILDENRQFRIALLDENGSIIQLSEPFSSNSKRGPLIDYIKYNAENNTLSLKYRYSGVPLYWIWQTNPKYTIIGIIIFIVVIKFLITKYRRFISRHNNSE